jgi:hypothetical protein
VQPGSDARVWIAIRKCRHGSRYRRKKSNCFLDQVRRRLGDHLKSYIRSSNPNLALNFLTGELSRQLRDAAEFHVFSGATFRGPLNPNLISGHSSIKTAARTSSVAFLFALPVQIHACGRNLIQLTTTHVLKIKNKRCRVSASLGWI